MTNVIDNTLAAIALIFIIPLIATVVVLGLVTGAFALWFHSFGPFLVGIVLFFPFYIGFFFLQFWVYGQLDI